MRSARSLTRTAELRRDGYVLPFVLLTVIILALGAYAFSGRMLVEYEAVGHFKRQAVARQAALSGLDYVTAVLDSTPEEPLSRFHHNPGLFQDVPVSPNGSARFSVVNPTASTGRVEFGIADESSKFNLELLASLDDQELARDFLLAVPDMSPSLADALLDWVDPDDKPRRFGAEGESYSNRKPPFAPRNAAPDSLRELVSVRGMTAELLFGEDHNRNGILDPNENDGALRVPLDDADGRLDRGFAAWLTINSRETRVRSDGRQRIDLNIDSLVELYDTLEPEFGPDVARFVIAYRRYGPFPPDPSARIQPPPPKPEFLPSEPPDEEQLTSNTAEEAAAEPAPVDLEPQYITSAISGVRPEIRRAGIRVDKPPRFKFNSIYDLIGRTAAFSDTEGHLIQSPWIDAPQEIQEQLRLAEDMLAVSTEKSRPGRLNVVTASDELIAAIPFVGRTLRDMRRFEDMSLFHISDLYTSSRIDVETLRKVAPLITSRGDVGTVQILGYAAPNGPVYRLEALVDATHPRQSRMLWVRDLTPGGSNLSLLRRLSE